MMEDCLEKKAEIEYAPMHAADVLATWANVDKAEKLLGWKAQMSIEEGVRRTVDWYTQNREWAKGIKT